MITVEDGNRHGAALNPNRHEGCLPIAITVGVTAFQLNVESPASIPGPTCMQRPPVSTKKLGLRMTIGQHHIMANGRRIVQLLRQT